MALTYDYWAGPLRVITVKIPEEMIEKLDSFARLRGWTRSEVIRRAIELYLRVEDYHVKAEPKVVRLTS